MSGAELARQLGTSEWHGRRLLAEIRTQVEGSATRNGDGPAKHKQAGPMVNETWFDDGATRRRCFSGWNLNNLDEHRTAVLMFKVKPQGPARLGMWFNGKVWEIYYTFDTSDSESVRSFHEVVLGKHLYGANNELCVESREIDAEIGQLEISDIVLFYHGQT
jgi:hypothetical protein